MHMLKKKLVSYVDKKKLGKKNVFILTTMHDEFQITKHQQFKSDVLTKIKSKVA